MKRTPELNALCQPALKADEIHIHPNEGFDLGMMTTSYDVVLDGDMPAKVKLINDCPAESIEFPPRLYEKLGKPKRAILQYDGTKLFIVPR